MTVHLPVDHAIVLVPDLEHAGAAFEDVGFTVTPQTRHGAAMGTANRCIMLDGTYVELMGILTETPANAPWRTLLQQGAGLRGIALRSADIAATAAGLEQRGIGAEAPRDLSRETDHGTLRFAIQRIVPEETPGLQCLYCRHDTPDLLWRPEFLRHRNGASRLRALRVGSVANLMRLEEASGVVVDEGTDRLVIAAHTAGTFDLKETCGIELTLVTA